MVETYWKIGQRIVEEEQDGASRAEYGAKLIENLSKYLTDTFGKGFSEANLKNMRQFYLTYPEFDTQCVANLSWTNIRTLSDNGLETIEYVSIDCTNSDGIWKSDSEIKIDKNSYVILNGNKTKEFWNGTIKSEQKPLRLKVRNICGDESIIKL